MTLKDRPITRSVFTASRVEVTVEAEVDPSELLQWCDNALTCYDPAEAIRGLREAMVEAGIKRPSGLDG